MKLDVLIIRIGFVLLLALTGYLLNPLAVKELFNSGGQSLVRGLSHLFDDLLHNDGLPRQVTKQAFEVGKTVATAALLSVSMR